VTTTYFYSDWGYAGAGDKGIPLPNFWYDPDGLNWQAEIVMDFVGHQMKATLTAITTGHTETTGWLPFVTYNGMQNELYAPDRMQINNYVATGQGVQIDNVYLETTATPPVGSIAVHVDLQDYTADNSLVPCRVELIQNDVVLRDAKVFLDAGNNLTLPAVDAGDYVVAVSACKWLRSIQPVTVTGGETVALEIPMLNGDLNGDNSVGFADFNILRKNWGAEGD
jgi:hypothetical protein